MPLPSPSGNIPQNAPAMNAGDAIVESMEEGFRKVNLTFKEAVTTSLKSSVMTMQMKFLEKIPLVGKGLADKIDLKKREMFEEQGRDPLTGKKLTKGELEEKELRKKSMGAMGDIRDSVYEILDILTRTFGPSSQETERTTKKDKAKGLTPSADGEGAYALADEVPPPPDSLAQEEKLLEQQQKDREIQEEKQEKEETFFKDLFEKYFGNGKNDQEQLAVAAKGEGLFGKIANTFDFLSDAKSLGAGRLLGKIPGLGRVAGMFGAGGAATAGAAGTARAAGAATRMVPAVPLSTAVLEGADAPARIRSIAGAGSQAAGSASSAAGSAASGGGLFSRIGASIKSVGSSALNYGGKALGAVKNAGAGLVKLGVGPLAKTIFSVLGPVLSAVQGYMAISDIKENPNLSDQEKKEQIGLKFAGALTSIGSQIAALLLAPGPGNAIVGALDALGYGPGALGEFLASMIGGEKIYDLATQIPGLGSFLEVPKRTESEVNSVSVTSPTSSVVGPPTTATAQPSEPMVPKPGETVATPPTPMEGGGIPTGMEGGGIPTGVEGGRIPVGMEGGASALVPATTPSSSATLSSLQSDYAYLKSTPPPATVVAPTNNAVVTNNNTTSWMSSLTTTRTGVDIDERAFRMGLAY